MDKAISTYGAAELDMLGPVEAGAFTTIKYIYTAEHPIDRAGYIKLAFRAAGDFGIPQFNRPGDDNYCSVYSSGKCRIIPRWDAKGNISPWYKALYLQIEDYCLDSGEKITVIFGDTSKGSRGWQLQTFVEETFEFKTFVDLFAVYDFAEMPFSPSMPIIHGEPVRAVCLTPSQVKINEEFAFYLKVEDAWGNPASQMDKIIHPGFPEPGIEHIEISDREFNLETYSQPISVVEELPELKYYWADFHGETEETTGTNDIEDYFYFGCYWSRLNILGHQGCDFQINDTFWQRIKETSNAYNAPEKFVSFPGYEWCGSTFLGGSRNIFFLDSDGEIHRSSRAQIEDHASSFRDAPTAELLFEALKKQPTPSFSFIHAGGRCPNLDIHDPEIEIALEIHSIQGTFEWLLDEVLKRGKRFGICANSGDLTCRPGSPGPTATGPGATGGLTCVLAPALNRDDVYQAIKKRHTYATTGNRCLLDVKLNIDEHTTFMMGDLVRFASGKVPTLVVKLAGSAPIERVEVYNGSKLIYTKRSYKPANLGSKIKVLWSGAENRGRNCNVDWSGMLDVMDNQIKSVIPINISNPNYPVQMNSTQVKWKSATAGGVAGCILDLEDPFQGKLQVETAQGVVIYDLSRDGFLPKNYKFGGEKKIISIYRLPDDLSKTELKFKYNLDTLYEGDNPIYIKVIQQDGHMAWSSPIYIIPM